MAVLFQLKSLIKKSLYNFDLRLEKLGNLLLTAYD